MTYPIEKELLTKLEDFYKKEKQKQQKQAEKNAKNGKGGQGGTGQGSQQKLTKAEVEEIKEAVKEAIKKLIEEHEQELRKKSELLESEHDKFPEPTKEEKDEVKGAENEKKSDIESASEGKMHEQIADAKKNYGARANEFLENNLDRVDTDANKLLAPNSTLTAITPSGKIRQKLSNIKNRYEEENMKTGKKLDINRVIQSRLSPSGSARIFQKPDTERGVEFFVMLDLSGSMDGGKLQQEKEILATLYDSIIPFNRNVKIRMFGFAGEDISINNDEGSHVFEFDRKKLGNLKTGGSTPTGTALAYIAKEFKKNSSVSKNLILITDGYPNGLGHEPSEKVIDEQIRKIKGAGANVFTVFIGGAGMKNYEEAIKRIFKSSNKTYDIESPEESRRVLEDVIVGDISRKLMA